MEEVNFKQKVKEMSVDCIKYIEKEADRLFNCGGIDTSSYENNYLLPKIILYVALRNLAEQYRPLSNAKKEADNLLHF
jgi:hypothetical protein